MRLLYLFTLLLCCNLLYSSERKRESWEEDKRRTQSTDLIQPNYNQKESFCKRWRYFCCWFCCNKQGKQDDKDIISSNQLQQTTELKAFAPTTPRKDDKPTHDPRTPPPLPRHDHPDDDSTEDFDI